MIFCGAPGYPCIPNSNPPANDTAQHSTQHTTADQAHSSRPATQQQTPTQHELQHRQRARWSRGSGRSHVAGDDHTAVVEALQGCCQMQPVRQVVCLLHRADGGSLRQGCSVWQHDKTQNTHTNIHSNLCICGEDNKARPRTPRDGATQLHTEPPGMCTFRPPAVAVITGR